MIKDIFVFPNGMVAVCNDKGEQIPSLQGRCSKRKQILAYLTTKFPEIKLHGEISFQKKDWENEQQDVNPLFLPMLIRWLTESRLWKSQLNNDDVNKIVIEK